MIYFVYACEQKYGGLYGMYNYDFIKTEHAWNISELNDYMREMSFDIMNSYGEIISALEEEARWNMSSEVDQDEDYDEWEREFKWCLEEAYNENIDGYWCLMKPEYDALDIKEAEALLQNEFGGDIDEFVKVCCI